MDWEGDKYQAEVGHSSCFLFTPLTHPHSTPPNHPPPRHLSSWPLPETRLPYVLILFCDLQPFTKCLTPALPKARLLTSLSPLPQLDDQEYEPSPGPDSTSNDNKSSSGGADEDQKHHNQVQGGIKAAISNPKVSDEKKEELKQRID